MGFRLCHAEYLIRGLGLLGLAWAIACPSVQAEEGFSSSLASAPAAVQRAWRKTFAVVSDNPQFFELGTAALIAKFQKDNQWHLYFLTANHAVDRSCQEHKVCPRTSLAQNLRGRVMSNQGLVFDKVEVIKRSTNPDLALLRVVAAPAGEDLPEALSIAARCDVQPAQKLFAVGYPATENRVHPTSDPIADKGKTLKRWSRGIFVDKYRDGKGSDMRLFYGTTIDALAGSSGGPVLNDLGEVVGVVIACAGTEENGFSYQGNEADGQRDWHSLMARCEDLQIFRAHIADEDLD